VTDTDIRRAGRLLEDLTVEIGPVEMGFRIQGIAAHILLAMGYSILEIKSSSHPDIIARNKIGITRVEVEANIQGIGTHLPLPADIASLLPQVYGDRGLFAISICSPLPKWIVIDYNKFQGKKNKLPISVLEALSNKELSNEWSQLFIKILTINSSHLKYFSFEYLSKLAKSNKCLIDL
jgi:hypothetical protein